MKFFTAITTLVLLAVFLAGVHAAPPDSSLPLQRVSLIAFHRPLWNETAATVQAHTTAEANCPAAATQIASLSGSAAEVKAQLPVSQPTFFTI
ncbi:unnamed protein product [Jaminaea pallidilutea]